MKAFSIVEIIIAVAIISIALFAINELLGIAFNTTQQGLQYTKATFLAEEGLEVARILRDQSWQGAIAPLNTGVTYYPVLSGTTWSLQTSSPGLIDNLYTRIVTVDNVYRDANSNIAALGTLDTNTKKIVVAVQWQAHGTTKEVRIPTYLTNIFNN